MNTDRDYVHKDLTGDIIAAAFNVHNALGCGLLENVYDNALLFELALNGKKATSQKEFKVIYREKEVAWIIQQTNKRAVLTAKHMKPQIARLPARSRSSASA